MTEGVNINAFPPELPPRPDGDDVAGDELDHQAPAAAATPPADATEPESRWPLDWRGQRVAECDYCGGPSSLAVVYLADGEREHACYPCHGTMIAEALNQAADAATAEAPA